jgi:hypothetical protein
MSGKRQAAGYWHKVHMDLQLAASTIIKTCSKRHLHWLSHIRICNSKLHMMAASCASATKSSAET